MTPPSCPLSSDSSLLRPPTTARPRPLLLRPLFPLPRPRPLLSPRLLRFLFAEFDIFSSPFSTSLELPCLRLRPGRRRLSELLEPTSTSRRLSSDPALPLPDKLSRSTSLDSAGDFRPSSSLRERISGLSTEFVLSGVAGGESEIFNELVVFTGKEGWLAVLLPSSAMLASLATLAKGISTLEPVFLSSLLVALLF